MHDSVGSLQFNKLPQTPLIHAADARACGVHPSLLSYYAKIGRLERVARGVYRNPQIEVATTFQWEDLVLASQSIQNGVVCLVSALAVYRLSEEMPRQHWIAVSHNTTAPRREMCKIVRMRNMTLGVTEITLGSASIRIFDQERTIVDAFRFLGKETAIKALKKAFAPTHGNKPDVAKIRLYARTLRVALDDFLLMVTT